MQKKSFEAWQFGKVGVLVNFVIQELKFSIFLGSFASVFLVFKRKFEKIERKIKQNIPNQNVSDCEEEEVLEINNFELIDLDEIEEIQGAPFKSEPFENNNFPIALCLLFKQF